MNRRLLIVLAAVTAAAVVLALLVDSREAGPSEPTAGSELAPGLSHAINQVERVRLTAPEGDGVITLERVADGWRIAERDGYRADGGNIRQLLIRLSEARILEEKTANPDLYPRLGVEDVDTDSGTGVLVEIFGGAEGGIIVGKPEPRANRGTYVRRVGEAGSLLVDQTLAPGQTAADWLSRDLIDVPENRVRAVVVEHTDGDRVVVRRGEDGTFSLDNLPEGREVSAAGGPATLARALSALRLDDVRRLDESGPPEDATLAEFTTDDGRLITAHLWRDGETRLISLGVEPAEADTGPAGEAAGAQAEEAANADTGEAADDEPGIDTEPMTADEIAELDERLAGWAYAIPVWKHEQLDRRLEDLLTPLPEPETSEE